MSSNTSAGTGFLPPLTGFFGGLECGAVRKSSSRYSSCHTLKAFCVFNASSYRISVLRADGGRRVKAETKASGSEMGANRVLTMKSAASSHSASSGVGRRSMNGGGKSESESSSSWSTSMVSRSSSRSSESAWSASKAGNGGVMEDVD
jgi:hypothetical protein